MCSISSQMKYVLVDEVKFRLCFGQEFTYDQKIRSVYRKFLHVVIIYASTLTGLKFYVWKKFSHNYSYEEFGMIRDS